MTIAAAVFTDGTLLLDPTATEEADAAAIVTLGYMIKRRANGSADRQLLLAHTAGCMATQEQLDACRAAAQEAAVCAAEFQRQSLMRVVAPLHEVIGGLLPPPRDEEKNSNRR